MDTYKLTDEKSEEGTLYVIYKNQEPFDCYIQMPGSLTMRGETNKVSVISRFGERGLTRTGVWAAEGRKLFPPTPPEKMINILMKYDIMEINFEHPMNKENLVQEYRLAGLSEIVRE